MKDKVAFTMIVEFDRDDLDAPINVQSVIAPKELDKIDTAVLARSLEDAAVKLRTHAWLLQEKIIEELEKKLSDTVSTEEEVA